MTLEEPLSPACMKCVQVTGKSTCFPAPCKFYQERNIAGTKSHDVATLDRIRRGAREPVYVSENFGSLDDGVPNHFDHHKRGFRP